MKATRIFSIFCALVAFAFPSGCAANKPTSPDTPSGPSASEPDKPSASEPDKPSVSEPIAPDYFTADADKIANFANGEPTGFHKANGYSNGNMFDCMWSWDNIWIDSKGIMQIVIREKPQGDYKYTGGEYRTYNNYSFGYFSTCMKAAKCSGVVSSLFTYTNQPRWDEIDIEFLGKDTTKVQFNYYTNGQGGHEYLYDLGFDAAEGFHEYAFLWTSDAIVWFVDGKAVYKATKDIPQYAGQIMTNVWNGKGVDDWLDKFVYPGRDVVAQYKWIGYKAA